MSRKRQPEKKPLGAKNFIGVFLLRWVPLVVFIIIIITGARGALEYCLLFIGNMPTEIQRMTLDYSLSIFGGGIVFLLVYAHELERLICLLLNIKSLKK